MSRMIIDIGVTGNIRTKIPENADARRAALRLVRDLNGIIYDNEYREQALLHLEVKSEMPPLPGQSRLARTLAAALMGRIAAALAGPPAQPPTHPAWLDEATEILDRELEQIRLSHEPLSPCPIVTNHPEGPCHFCTAYAMRDVLILKGR